MFSVVIADDEPLIIKGLMKMVDWEKLNTQVIGTSRNGEQLIRQIDEMSPDIIISDISMPHQSGIDVIKYINEKGLKSKVIFLSAFQEFEYAKQALRYGVIEYLLKPVTKEELELSIIKAERALKDNLSLEYLQEDAKSAQAVFKAVTSEYEYQDLYKKFEQMGVPTSDASYTGACFSAVEDRGRAEKNRSEFELLRFTVFKKIEDHAVKRKNGFCLKREADFCNMIFFYGKNQEETILTDVKALIRTMEREYGIRLTAGIGKRTDSLSDLKFAYKTAAFACNLYYFKQDPVIIYDRINKEYHHSFDDYNEAYSALVKAILLRDDMWLDQLKQCLELIGELHYGNRVVAENRCVALLMELLRELGNYCRLDEEDRHKYEGFVSGIRSVGTFQKVKAMILRYLEQFVEKTVFSNLGNENETIRGIKFYIRENYDQEINLRSLSQHFFMNQYYFSSFFKQKTGKNFKDYLVEVRMQKALELLLENSGMSTQELARKVGYNDAKSFSEKFRQYYGESPVNYKKINKM